MGKFCTEPAPQHVRVLVLAIVLKLKPQVNFSPEAIAINGVVRLAILVGNVSLAVIFCGMVAKLGA